VAAVAWRNEGESSEGKANERHEARGSRQEELRRRAEEVLQQEREAVAVRLRNEARTLRGVGEAYEEVMQHQQALVDTHREVSDSILQLASDLQRGRVSLGTREVIEVQRALQLGWRPTTPEEEDEPEYHEVDLTLDGKRERGPWHGEGWLRVARGVLLSASISAHWN
jgi:hypothetical protein